MKSRLRDLVLIGAGKVDALDSNSFIVDLVTGPLADFAGGAVCSQDGSRPARP